jgi:NCS1 family nucleobase:cation symporter-1
MIPSAIAIGTIAVNAMNDYTGSLSLQAAGARIPRVYSAIAVAILGFLFTLYLNSGDLVSKFENYLLFIIYWVTPWAGVVLADWWLRGRRADVSRLADYASLPSGLAGLAALLIGFIVSLPFGTSVFGQEIADATGLPVNGLAATLHYADIAYVVGFVVAFGVYWVLGRGSVQRA